jgi:heat shock protein HslJ
MRKGLFYICLLLVGVGLFAGCKSKKAVVASFSDLDGEWGVVEMNGKTLNPEETHQVLVFDVARQGLSGNAGCNRLMGKIEYNDAYKNIIKFPQVATTRMACPDMSGVAGSA